MEHLRVGDTIRIPTGVSADSDNFYLPAASPGAVSNSSARTPSIVFIHSPSRKNRLNKFQEVPKIGAGKSKIPTLQRSVVPSTFLRTNIYGQPVNVSQKSLSQNIKPSASFPTDRATYERLLTNSSASRQLPVLPAIGVSSLEVSGHYTPRQTPTMATKGTGHVALPPAYNTDTTKQFYHVTNAKPVFQMKAEYNNMIQRYANNMEEQLRVPHQHQEGAPCRGCGRHVSAHSNHSSPNTAPTIPPADTNSEQNYVQQWLVNPSHPYQLPSEETKANVASVPLVFTTPSVPAISAPETNTTSDRNTVKQTVPIRYTQAPTQQIVSKTSGKLLSPEDALKRTLKKKKIPPLTKRNSLRSIFSDASSNLQKIAEEMEEDHESGGLSVSQSVNTSALPSATSYSVASRQSVADGDIRISVQPIRDGARKVLERGSVCRTHYALLCRLVVEAGNLVLNSVFNKIYPPLSLADNLSKPQVQKSLRRLKSQGILSTRHWELLYPKRKSTVTSDNFSSTLLVILLKSICHLSPPYPNGWKDLPLPGDKGLSADLARISWYRRHVASMDSLPDDQFSTHWNQLCTIFTRLSAPASTSLIKRIQREVLSYDDQSFYIQALATSQREEENLALLEKKAMPRNHGNRRGTIQALRMKPTLRKKSGTFVVSNNLEQSSAKLSQRKKSTGSRVTWSIGNGLVSEDSNTLLVCYKLLVDNIEAEVCLEYLLDQRVITADEKSRVTSCQRNEQKMKELLELLTNKNAGAYKEILRAVESAYPEVAAEIKNKHSTLTACPALKSTDIRAYLKRHVQSMYSTLCSEIQPYFWDSRIKTDIKSHYIQLDVTDIKGRSYPIERVFTESPRSCKVLLQGEAGSGKTMYCYKLIYDWSRGDILQRFDLVVYLDVKKLGVSLEETVYNQLSGYQTEVKLSREEVMSLLMAAQHNLLFIVDLTGSQPVHPLIFSLLKGEIFEKSSLLITCLPEQVAELSPFCQKRLINLGLDPNSRKKFIERYALLNRNIAQGYGNVISNTLLSLGKAYEYMMRIPEWLQLLCLLVQNEEEVECITTPSLLLSRALSIYPFLFSIQQGVPYDPDNPNTDVLYALNQLQSIALETVMKAPSSPVPYEHIQHKYGCKLLMQLGILHTYTCMKDNKPQQMVTFSSSTIQLFLAACKLSLLPSDQISQYLESLLTDLDLRRLCVYFISCKRGVTSSPTSSHLQQIFSLLAKQNRLAAAPGQDGVYSLADYSLSLTCVHECEDMKNLVRIVGQSLPSKLLISLQQIHSSAVIKGLNRIMEKNFSKVSHISIVLESSAYFSMNSLLELAECIKNSTSVTQLNLSYTSTELLTHFLHFLTNEYRANILTLVFECKAAPTEKLSASTYTDLKSAISSLSGITAFRLSGCRNSLALRNVVRNLPHTLHTLEITESLLDSSALDITAYLDGAPALHLLNLEGCELSDGATGMNLFKGVRNNKSLVQLRLRGAALNTQTIKVLCEALKFNRVLQYLDVRNMELSTQACVSLAGVISVNDSLREIKLSQSFASADGLTILDSGRAKDSLKLIIE